MAIPIPPQAPMQPQRFNGGTALPHNVIPVEEWHADHPTVPARGAVRIDDWPPDRQTGPTVLHYDQRGRSRSPATQFVVDDVFTESTTKKAKKVVRPVETSYRGYVLQRAKPLANQQLSWRRVSKRVLPFDDKKLLALVHDHRRRSRTHPIADFGQLGSNQKDVILRLIAQHKEEERNPDADWTLVDVQKDGIRHLIAPMEVRKIQIVLKRQDQSAIKPGEKLSSGLASSYQVDIIDLSEPASKKTGKVKGVIKKPQLGDDIVYVEPFDSGVTHKGQRVAREEPVQFREPAQHDRNYQQPHSLNLPNPVPRQGQGQGQGQGHDHGQRYDNIQHDFDPLWDQSQPIHQPGFQQFQDRDHNQGLGIAQQGHGQPQPLPYLAVQNPRIQASPPLPFHSDTFPLMPRYPPPCPMPPLIPNPFMPHQDFIPPEQFMRQERSQSPLHGIGLPYGQRNARPGTPRRQRSASAKRVKQLEGKVESLTDKMDRLYVNSDSSTADDSIFSSPQSKESFTPPSTPPRRVRVPKGILHHGKSFDHRAEHGNQTSDRRHKDERGELRPAYTHQPRDARHSPERRGDHRERRPQSPEGRRDSFGTSRYSDERRRYSPDRFRDQGERRRYREDQSHYREEQRPAPGWRRTSTYEHSPVERDLESRYMPQIQRRLTDYDMPDIEQYHRQRESFRRRSNDRVQEAYEAGRRENERRRSGAGYYL